MNTQMPENPARCKEESANPSLWDDFLLRKEESAIGDDYTILIEAFEKLILAAHPMANEGPSASVELGDVLEESVALLAEIDPHPRNFSLDEWIEILSRKHTINR